VSDTQNDIDELVQIMRGTKFDVFSLKVSPFEATRYHAALTALIAERDDLSEKCKAQHRTMNDMIETQRNADRELRERLVCLILPEMLRVYINLRDASVQAYSWNQTKEFSRWEALEEADAMIAAMREQGGGA